MNWNKLPLLRPLCKNDAFYTAINSATWQDLRLSLRNTTTAYKYIALVDYARRSEDKRKSSIQITNYVNALLRGGLIKYDKDHRLV